MGDHGHKTGEVMLSYRFMAMDMQGLQSGTTSLETTDVLKGFMVTPTQMGMQMHAIGAMFAPHDKLTLMAMVGYQQRNMEMEGTHDHKEGHHEHPIGTHEMSSAGIGDIKLESLLTVWKTDHLNLIGNIGVSLPTGSIAQTGTDGNVLPYPMQLGSGSFAGGGAGYHIFWVSWKLVLRQPTAWHIFAPYQYQQLPTRKYPNGYSVERAADQQLDQSRRTVSIFTQWTYYR